MKYIKAQKKKCYTYLYMLCVSGVSGRIALKNDIAVQKAILTNNTVFKCKLAYTLIQQCLEECTSELNPIF